MIFNVLFIQIFRTAAIFAMVGTTFDNIWIMYLRFTGRLIQSSNILTDLRLSINTVVSELLLHIFQLEFYLFRKNIIVFN